MATKQRIVEKMEVYSGDVQTVWDAILKFKDTHTVIREFMTLQVMMLPGKVNGSKIISPGQQQMQLQPTQILNEILIFEE